jgi:2,4-dienoyl-CoA reductase-like NADH-dependent reductase (Old Yellow Enzyme family)/thioredoxin reductase
MTQMKDNAATADGNGKRPFEALAQPLRIGSVDIRNRIAFPGMITGFGSPEGHLTERGIDYYVERARGGAGLIIVEPAAVLEEGRQAQNGLLFSEERFIPAHEALCNAVHAAGARVLLQISHAGRKAVSHVTGTAPVAPSPEPDPDVGEVPVELTCEHIEGIVAAFITAASRAREAGFDGVEILGSGGYLVHQFLSSHSNLRTDGYGVSVEARARFLTEIVSPIRATWPAGLVSVRIGPGRKEYYHVAIDDLLRIAQLAVAAGASCINVAAGGEMLPRTDHVPIASPGQVCQPMEPLVKKAVAAPIIGGSAVLELSEAEDLVASGRVDMVELGQPMIADPEFAAKALSGRLDQARPCIHCNVCQGRPPAPTMMCPANPAVGREHRFARHRAVAGRSVIIIGSGLAGLWTAKLAAEIGYAVTIYEPGNILGNLLAIRSRIPGRAENYALIDCLSRQLNAAGVRVFLKRAVAVRDVLRERPDAVFVTRIGPLQEPEVNGLVNVQTVDPVTVLTSDPSMGDKVVVMGGGLMGAEVAYYLARRNKQVALVEEKHQLAHDTDPDLRQRIVGALREMNCLVFTAVSDIEVNIYGEITARHEGRTLRLLVDTVVLAADYERCDQSFRELEGKVPSLHLIGDAYEAGELTKLVYDATSALIDMADRLQASMPRHTGPI